MAFTNEKWTPFWDIGWDKCPKLFNRERRATPFTYTAKVQALALYLNLDIEICYDYFLRDFPLRGKRKQALIDLCGPHGTTLMKMKLINLGVYDDFEGWPEP